MTLMSSEKNLNTLLNEALNLDSYGQSQKAVALYLECIKMMISDLRPQEDPRNRILGECVERVEVLLNTRKPSLNSSSVQRSLDALRRVHEKEALGGSRLMSSSRMVVPRAQRKFQELLTYRQSLVARVQERLHDYLSDWRGDETGLAVETLRRNIVEEQGRAEQDRPVILSSLRTGLKESPFDALVSDFIVRQSKTANTAQNVIEECRLFEWHVVDLLNCSTSHSSMLEASVRLTIQEILFDALGPLISSAQRHRFSDAQRDLTTRILSYRNKDLHSLLELNPRLHPTLTVPIEMCCLSAYMNPMDKLLALVRTCTQLCSQQDDIGGEDLLRLHAMSIIKYLPGDLLSELHLIGELVPESVLRGEAGYVLATFNGAIEFLSIFE